LTGGAHPGGRQAILAAVRQAEIRGISGAAVLRVELPGLILEAPPPAAPDDVRECLLGGEHGDLASSMVGTLRLGPDGSALVDKIIKGANPADLPVEVNTNIEFAIN